MSSFHNTKTTSATTTTTLPVKCQLSQWHCCLLVITAFTGHLEALLSIPMFNPSPIPVDLASIILDKSLHTSTLPLPPFELKGLLYHAWIITTMYS